MGKHYCTLGYFNPVLSLSGMGNQMPFKDGKGEREGGISTYNFY